MDESVLAELLAKRAVENGRSLFSPPEEALLQQCCVERVTLATTAERLTILRKPLTEGETKRARINGEVARHLRPRTHGLLLIYPLVPTENRWPTTPEHPNGEPPFMGLAFSFPSSHTARAVDYKVNKVWQTTFHDEDYAD